MNVFAHRGISALHPENSQTAIEAACEQNVYGVEIDLIQVGSRFIVFHDRWLGRILGIHQPTRSLNELQLNELRLPDGLPIPDLQWLIETIAKRDIILNIELKHIDDMEAFNTLLSKLVDEHKVNKSRLIVSSFNHSYLHRLFNLNDGWQLGLLMGSHPVCFSDYHVPFSFYSVHLDMDAISAELVGEVKAKGYPVYVFTVDNSSEISWLIDLGVDGVFANDPIQAQQFIESFANPVK